MITSNRSCHYIEADTCLNSSRARYPSGVSTLHQPHHYQGSCALQGQELWQHLSTGIFLKCLRHFGGFVSFLFLFSRLLFCVYSDGIGDLAVVS